MTREDRANGVAALQAMLVGDEAGSYSHLRELNPDALHELMGMCLLVAGMARETMLGDNIKVEWGVQYAHKAAQSLREQDAHEASQHTPHTDGSPGTSGP